VDQYIKMQRDREVEAISDRTGGEVRGVVNRFDTLIPLHGKLVDAFSVPGPSYEAVMQCKNKAAFDRLMRKEGLGRYRPNTQELTLSAVGEYLRMVELPRVVKPFIGSKSRGVRIIRHLSDWEAAEAYLRGHFRTVERHGIMVQPKVLVEELVTGEMITAVTKVDHTGGVEILTFERVLTGKDVGQQHQQLVYRTVPAMPDGRVKQAIETILTGIVAGAGLTSTFLHPEFLVEGVEVKVMEVNVRIGGFRRELLTYAYGVDLDELAVRLALGEAIAYEPKRDGSCTAVEVWEETSGVIERLELPEDERMKGVKVYFEKGDEYVAPPAAQKPLARYYVVSEGGSLEVAQKLRAQVNVEIE
jgi:biotin carboxylase